MLRKRPSWKFSCITAAVAAGMLLANLGCISSAQLRDFAYTQLAVLAADAVADLADQQILAE